MVLSPSASPDPALGVVLVTYDASDVILPCLESLMASEGMRLAIQIIDNASTDDTAGALRRWAAGRDVPVPLEEGAVTLAEDGHRVALIETGANTGFAGGVNRGLEALARLPELDRFWVLNPDTTVPPHTARAFATHPEPPGGFALMGGRVCYADRPDMIQIDGGTINRWTGVTGSLNLFAPHPDTPPPDPAEIEFVMGGSMVASRRFYEAVGPLREDYFLYYEEVDWALRRGDLPLLHCPKAVVYHEAGTAIGSATHGRLASPFALYFKNRARVMFLKRFYPLGALTSWAWTLGKAGQYLAKGYGAGARAILAGAMGLAPPRAVAARLSPEACARIGVPSEARA